MRHDHSPIERFLESLPKPSFAWRNKNHYELEVTDQGHQFFDPLLSYFQMREPDEALLQSLEVVGDRIKHWSARNCLEMADSESLPHLMAEPGWSLVRNLDLDFGKNFDLVERLVTSPQVQNLEFLALTGESLDRALVKKMVSSPFLKRLRSLHLYCRLDDEAFETFAKSPLAEQLDVCSAWKGSDAHQWYDSSQTLKEIELWANDLELLESPLVDSLESLNVYVSTLEDMVKLKNASRTHPLITDIELADTKTAECTEILAGFTDLRRLRRLRIEGDVRDSAGIAQAIQSLSNASFLPQIKELVLNIDHDGSWNEELRKALEQPGDWVTEALGRWPLNSLLELTIRGCRITDEGIAALINNQSIQSLRLLDLEDNRITDEGLRRLVNWPGMSSLEHLKVYDNPISQVGIGHLAASKWCGNLRILNLPRADGSLEALSQSETMVNLEKVSSWSLSAGPQAYQALVDSVFFHNLVDLDVSGCRIGDDDLQILFGNKTPARLRSLSLAYNPITDEGIKILTRCNVVKNLTWLDLRADQYGDLGLELLANAPFSPWFCSLGIGTAHVTGDGMRRLARSKVARSLRWVELECYGVGKGDELIEPWLASPNVSPVVKTRFLDVANRRYFDYRPTPTLKERFRNAVD